MGLAEAAPVRVVADVALDEVEPVEVSLGDLGVGAAEAADGEVHPGGEVAQRAVVLVAVLVLQPPVCSKHQGCVDR